MTQNDCNLLAPPFLSAFAFVLPLPFLPSPSSFSEMFAFLQNLTEALSADHENSD